MDVDVQPTGGILESPATKVTQLAPTLGGSEETRKTGHLEKRITGKTVCWVKKEITLTSEYLFFKNVESQEVKEAIKLVDITQVFRSSPHRNQSIVGLGSSTESQSDILQEQADLAGRTGSEGNQSTGSRRAKRHHNEENAIDELDFHNALSIHLQKYGRMCHLRASSKEECEDWIDQISHQIKEAQRVTYEALGISHVKRCRERLKAIYDSPPSQTFIALILIAVFALNIYDAELQPEEASQTRKIIDHIDTVITVLFAGELVLQLFIYWFWQFFTDVWCLLDLLVVCLSIVETIMIELEIGGSVNTNFVRLLRIFRIVKIFSKMKVGSICLCACCTMHGADAAHRASRRSNASSSPSPPRSAQVSQPLAPRALT